MKLIYVLVLFWHTGEAPMETRIYGIESQERCVVLAQAFAISEAMMLDYRGFMCMPDRRA